MSQVPRLKIAVVGSGVSGLVAAYVLGDHHDVELFESDDRPGGHTNTVQVLVGGVAHSVDTGFIVYNDRTYPGLIRLFGRLGVETSTSSMSFSVTDAASGIEWRGSSISTLFAQRSNVVNRAFLRMVVDIARFNRAARALAKSAEMSDDRSIEQFLRDGKWSSQFLDWYLVPIGSAIWSADPRTFASMPMRTFAKFFDNHGLLRTTDRVQWRTVANGAVHYVDAILRHLGPRAHIGLGVTAVARNVDGVRLEVSDGSARQFDHVVIATHSDQALQLLSDATATEVEILGAIRYQRNVATLHTDARVMPSNRRAWASWNFHRPADPTGFATVTYDMNRLQGIVSVEPIFVTLNREGDIDPERVLATFNYEHPVFDGAAIKAQRRRREISGHHSTSYAGAYWGNGFHEDGVQSALNICRELGVEAPW